MVSAEMFEQETHSLSRALTPSPLHSPHRVPVTQCMTIEETKEKFYYADTATSFTFPSTSAL